MAKLFKFHATISTFLKSFDTRGKLNSQVKKHLVGSLNLTSILTCAYILSRDPQKIKSMYFQHFSTELQAKKTLRSAVYMDLCCKSAKPLSYKYCVFITVSMSELKNPISSSKNVETYHGRVVGYSGSFVADVTEVVEKKKADDPEEAADDEDHHDEATVQGALHLRRKLQNVYNPSLS